MLINQVGITDKRKETFDFSEPCTISSPQLIIRKDEKRVFKTLADMRADGSFAKISNKWFDRDVSKPPVAR